MGDDTVLCRSLARFKMFVSTRDEGLAPHIIGDGFWEMWITRAMVNAIGPGMVCIDAGANLGYFTVLMANLAGPDGKVVAIEPIPSTRKLLARNVAINGFGETVEIVGAALGAVAGETTLYMPPGEPKNATICDVQPDPSWQAFPVLVKPIDSLGLTRVDFVKIDV